MAKQRDEFEVEDAGGRLAKHQTSGRATLDVPSGLSLWKPKKAGSHTIDIIPYRVTDSILKYNPDYVYASPGKWYFERTYFIHKNIGVNNDSHTCIAKTFGKRCPICEARAEYNNSAHKEDRDRGYALRQSERQLFLIYDNDDREKGVQLWDVSNWNFGKHLDAYVEGARPKDKAAYRKFYHPTEGFTIRITATESSMGKKGESGGGGMNTVYSIHQFFDRDEPLPDQIINHGFDLDAIVRGSDYSRLKAIYTGIADDADDGEEDQEDEPQEQAPPPRPAARQSAPPARQQKAPPREPDPEPEPEETEEPVGDEQPAEAVELASGDTVEFEYRGNVTTGVVKKVEPDRGIVHIEVEGREKPYVCDLGDVTLIASDTTWDPPASPPPPPAPKTKAPASGAAKPTQVAPKAAPAKTAPVKAAPPAGDWADPDENEAERSFRPKPGDDDAPPPRTTKPAPKPAPKPAGRR